MKERPILFSTEMVRAIRNGRKTQTRRVAQYQPDIGNENNCYIENLKCPHGDSGDILWVRETWQKCGTGAMQEYFYKASFIGDNQDRYVYDAYGDIKWKPSIFMPREACRLRLKIINNRIERLQDITAMDAVSEGIERSVAECPHQRAEEDVQMFIKLWDSINNKRGYGWSKNPLVWVIEFEQIEGV